MNWVESISKAVAEGKTKSQFALPNGTYKGGLFFITDANNKILLAFIWMGDRWVHEYEAIEIGGVEHERSPGPSKPAPFGPSIVTLRIGPK